MSEHTKEPWIVSNESPNIIKEDFSLIGSNAGRLIASTSGHPNSGFFPTEEESIANARRIVACVNACAGIPTIIFEAWKQQGRTVKTELDDKRVYIDELTQQRDELLAAAKNLRDVKGRYNSEIALKRLIETIAKVESEK